MGLHLHEAFSGLGASPFAVFPFFSTVAVDRGYPAVLRCDNGPELACAAMADWAGERTGVHFIPPGAALAQRLRRVNWSSWSD